jgi:DNA-3-methyladenine glycosylase I
VQETVDGAVIGEDGLARCGWAASHPLNQHYHDTEWGVPVRGEAALFERIMLEAFQSGLSWLTILRKREAFRAAFHGFDPDAVAAFTEEDVELLMQDAGIVRNRAKILAAITNARAVIALRDEGGLDEFIWSRKPVESPAATVMAEMPTVSTESISLSKDLKKRGFVFVGPTTAYAMMQAIGLIDAHLVGCFRRGIASGSGA